MLKEFLLEEPSNQIAWSGGMPGVEVCRFSLPEPSQAEAGEIPVKGAPLHFETIYCLHGRMTLEPLFGEPYVVEAPGIFLLSHSSALRSCRYSGNLGGVLVAVDARAAKESLTKACSALGFKLDTRIVKKKMEAKNGCMALHGTFWTQAFFETLQWLPEKAQERYCVFKSVELLVLLCTQAPAPDGNILRSDGPLSPSLAEVGTYLQAHLSEKVTIELLSKQFSVSPTFLKERFRKAYGVPIHSFLVQQRLRRARELICTTRLPIQQIAQSVGYEGMSQFNTAFKREYGMTPGQYRKMSETATSRPF